MSTPSVPDALRAWLAAATPDRGAWSGHEHLVLTCGPGRAALVRRRVGPLLAGRRTDRGVSPTLHVVEEGRGRLGNLGGALAALRALGGHSDGRAALAAWRAGEARLAMVHAAGLGRRAEPLTSAERGDRSGLPLPGRVGDAPATLLSAVLAQTSPLAASQPPRFLDLIWCSQLFFPTLAPAALQPPTAPITKLVRGGAAGDHPDLGCFVLDGAGWPTAFRAQRAGGTTRTEPGASEAGPPGPVATDLGTCRLRADALDVLLAAWDGSAVDLDPDVTAALLGDARRTTLFQALQAAFGEARAVGVTDVGAGTPWWRLRRPAELLDAALALLPTRDDGAPLRHLLGLAHPVARAWIDGRYVEGPELTWEEVAHGARIGGVTLRDAIVVDAGLAADSALDGAVVSAWRGAVRARAAWLVGGGAPHAAVDGGLVWRWTGRGSPTIVGGRCELPDPGPAGAPVVIDGFLDAPPAGAAPAERRAVAPFPPEGPPADPATTAPLPPAVARALRDRLPAGDLRRLVDRPDLLGIAVARDVEPVDPLPTAAVGRALIAGRLPLIVPAAALAGAEVAPDPLADALVSALAEALCAPPPEGRAAFAARAVAEGRAPPRPPAPPADPLAALAAWRLRDDPDRRALDGLFASMDADPRAPRTPDEAWAWLRWRLDHRGDPTQAVLADLAALHADVREAVAIPDPDGGWWPAAPLRPPGPPDAIVDLDGLADALAARARAPGGPRAIGIAGPAAAGKSTLAAAVVARLVAVGAPVVPVDGDARTWPGDGLRYAQRGAHRDIYLYGPAIYDDARIAADLRAARHAGTAVADGVFLGLDPGVRALLDLRVAVIADDTIRRRDKVARDARPGGRRIDVVGDLLRKVLHEDLDGGVPTVAGCGLVWERTSGALWRR
jgi:hypothetical protein